jgi:hypothetical protein
MEKLCQICNKNKIEVYQLEFEGCFEYWMNKMTHTSIRDTLKFYILVKLSEFISVVCI